MRREQIIGGLKVFRRTPTELRKLEKNLISFGEAERVAISHCMSLQTAGQESNRTTVFWWSVHSMLGNDFDIFWWVIYLSAKINFDLMPVILWRCVEICLLTALGVTLGVTVVSQSCQSPGASGLLSEQTDASSGSFNCKKGEAIAIAMSSTT